MSKQIHYVVRYDTETRTFSIDTDTANAVFDGNGNVYNVETDEWGWIEVDNAEDCEHAHQSWSMLNVMIDDFKSAGEGAYA